MSGYDPAARRRPPSPENTESPVDLLLGSSSAAGKQASEVRASDARAPDATPPDGEASAGAYGGSEVEEYVSRPDGTLPRPVVYCILAVVTFVLFRIGVRVLRRRS